jgi:hypothetical protein
MAGVAGVPGHHPARPRGLHVPHLPWPFGLLDFVSRAFAHRGHRARHHRLPNADAQLVRAPGVLPADGKRRVVLTCTAARSSPAGQLAQPDLRGAVEVRRLAGVGGQLPADPETLIGMAVDDCYDGYRWLRLRGYEPDQIVLAGDSAGGYLALTLAQRLQAEGEKPAALVAISPLLQLDQEPKQAHPNIHSDALFGPGHSTRWWRSSPARPRERRRRRTRSRSTNRSTTSSPACRAR